MIRPTQFRVGTRLQPGAPEPLTSLECPAFGCAWIYTRLASSAGFTIEETVSLAERHLVTDHPEEIAPGAPTAPAPTPLATTPDESPISRMLDRAIAVALDPTMRVTLSSLAFGAQLAVVLGEAREEVLTWPNDVDSTTEAIVKLAAALLGEELPS